MPVTVKLCDLLSLLQYVEIFQNDKTGLLVSKVSGTALFVTVCHLCTDFLILWICTISEFLLHCTDSAVRELCHCQYPKYFPNAVLRQICFQNLGEREDGTKEEMRRGERLNELARKKDSYLLKPINTH